MGLGKTYSADYLIDSNGNTGVSGQVLISTATGIDWADGTAITGGPFLPLAGGTITGNVRFNDTFKAEFGSSADLQINHDATDSLINNATGHLTIRNGANDKNIFLQADNGSGGNTSYLTLNGASTHAYFSNPGNVGIGTTGPIDELHVEGVIQSKKQLLPSTSSTAGWYKIGTMSGFVQGGATAVLEIAGHQGYNALNSQDYLIKLFIKTSNASSTGPDGQGFNSWYERTGGNNATIEFKWNNSATNDYDLYMFIPTHSLRSWYSVKKGTGTWEHAGTSATDPGANSSAVLKATGLFNILDANVGIGTASPGAKLDINGIPWVNPADGVHSGWNFRQGGVFKGWVGYVDSNDVVNLSMDGSIANGINVNASHNVGIGTADPGAKLDVVVSNVSVTPNADSSGVFRKNGHNYISILSGDTNEGGVIFGNSADAADGYIAYKHGTGAADQAFAFGTANSERMRITKGGNVGIGTTAPGAKLDIHTATNTNGLLIREDTDDSITHNFYVDSSDNGVGVLYANGQSAKIQLNTAGNSYFNGGNVGIGTASPNAKLEVTGATPTGSIGYGDNANSGQLYITSNAGVGSQLGGRIAFGGIAGNGGGLLVVHDRIQYTEQ